MFIFTKVNLSSDLVCQQFIGAFRKELLKPFGLDQPEAFYFRVQNLKMVTRRDSQLLIFQDSFSFYIFRRTISPFQLFRQQYLFRCRNFPHFFTLWWARNNFGMIFLLCVHGFLLVHISRSCRLRWPKGLYLKFHFSKAV